jgi:hypothetical protein
VVVSGIEITVGNATVDISPVAVIERPAGSTCQYLPRDLMDATAATLLAINTPQSVSWAHKLYEMTATA